MENTAAIMVISLPALLVAVITTFTAEKQNAAWQAHRAALKAKRASLPAHS